jgi:drug/metabolite transporter (DMT)-like permease
MSRRNVALFGATIVSVIYGITFTIAKDVMPQYIDAYGFILLRVAMLCFGSLVYAEEKIALNDFPLLLRHSLVSLLTCLPFLRVEPYSHISASVIMVTTPMIVLILSAIILKERMRKRMVAGIILGLTGTAFLYYTVGQ